MNKYLTFKNLFIAALLLVILYLVTCKRKNTSEPQVISIPEQIERVRIDSVASEKYKDSIGEIIMDLRASVDVAEGELAAEKMRYNDLEKGINDILNQPIPDTCKPITDALSARISLLNEASKRKDISCENALRSKDRLMANKDLLVSKGKEDYRKLRMSFDTALAQQSILSKAVSSLKPKREFFIGITAVSNYNNFNNAMAGITADYKTKKGVIFGASFFNTKQVQLSYKKRLFKF